MAGDELVAYDKGEGEGVLAKGGALGDDVPPIVAKIGVVAAPLVYEREARLAKEYGVDTVEMHIDSITSDDVVLIHDDLLATGGTAMATLKLVNHF